MSRRDSGETLRGLDNQSERGGEMLVHGTSALLARCDYDALVSRFPGWMASVWPKIVRHWFLYGPTFDDRFYKRVMFMVFVSRKAV